MHELTSVAEVRRLFGDRFDAEITLAPPGMEIGTQHKYAFNILLDFKAEELMRPQAAEILRSSHVIATDSTNVCVGVLGFPLAGLLSEPIKIVQSPRVSVILYEAGYLHRQVYTDGRALPKEFGYPAHL